MERSDAANNGHGAGGETQTLEQLLAEVYENSVEELALGLGRPVEQVSSWLNGSEAPDEDAVEKINGLAAVRLGEGGDRTPPPAAHDEQSSIEQRL